jgi:hypothetical protein
VRTFVIIQAVTLRRQVLPFDGTEGGLVAAGQPSPAVLDRPGEGAEPRVDLGPLPGQDPVDEDLLLVVGQRLEDGDVIGADPVGELLPLTASLGVGVEPHAGGRGELLERRHLGRRHAERSSRARAGGQAEGNRAVMRVLIS